MKLDFLVEGAGGGGGGKKGGGNDKENTLKSRANARIAELLGEGEIVGLVNGAKSIFLDQTPLQNADDSYNFEGFAWQERHGLPDQEHIAGFAQVETPFAVEAEVKQKTGPILRTIVDENADAARVVLRIPALAEYGDKGEINGATLEYTVEVRGNQGAWQVAATNLIKNEKTTSPWQIAHRVALPHGQGPWDIRVTKITEDPESDKLHNSLHWESYTLLVEGKLTYPNSAYVFIEIDAEQFGSSIPTRFYEVRGLKVFVPSNYEPESRTYSGIWDGTFKIAWTNNPAWIFYDLITNDRYGLGEFIDPDRVDKWTLYQIARYCDHQIPSGFKNAAGDDIFEPRFTYNGVINNREEAHQALKNITNSFRGMAFWSLGQVYAVADMPADPVKLVTPANVVDGSFSYSGTSKKSRHSVALISWNDQQDFGRPAVEVVINSDTLGQYGWRETSITAHGCTSRGQAHRFGKWILDTEQHETETVEYTAGWDHADVKPFDIVAIADPRKAEIRTGGRLLAISNSQFKLDAPFEPVGTNLKLIIEMPDGTLETRNITGFADGGSVVNVSSAFSQRPVDNAVYIISSTSVTPRTYRVLTSKEVEDNQFQVTALFHDPNKYLRVEQDLFLDPISYRVGGQICPAPTNADVYEWQGVEAGVPVSKIVLSWSPGGPLAVRHSVTVTGPDGTHEYSNLFKPTLELYGIKMGLYSFSIRSHGNGVQPSQSLNLDYEAKGWEGNSDVLAVIGLETINGGEIWQSRDCQIKWTNLVPGGMPVYRDNVVDVYDADDLTLLRSETVIGESYTYTFERNRTDNEAIGRGPMRRLRFEVSVRDNMERVSPKTGLNALNPVPVTPTPTGMGGWSQIFVSWITPPEPDLEGTLVWVNSQPHQHNSLGFVSYDTKGSSLTIPVPNKDPLYVTIACYDSFGKDGLSYSAEVALTADMVGVDFDAPEIPTGLAITSSVEGEMARVNVTWNHNTEEDLSEYHLEVAYFDGNFVSVPTAGNFYTFTCLPGTLIRARLRALDVSQNKSFYTDVVEHIAAADNVAPATPDAPTARASFQSVWLTWAESTETDMSHYDIEVRAPFSEDGESPVVDTRVFRSASNTFIISGLKSGDQVVARVRAVDTSGNASDWSESTATQTVGITPVDFDKESMHIIAAVDQLPDPIITTTPVKVYLTPEKKFYVIHEEDGEKIWLEETAAALITGQLGPGQIAPKAITTEKIDIEAVQTDNLALGSVGTTRISPMAISTPKLRSNAVTARKVRAGAIVADHIQADAIDAVHIRANAIQTNHLEAGSVIAETIAANAVETDHLAAGSVVAGKIAANAVDADAIQADAITANKIKAGEIEGHHIKAGSIGAEEIAAGSIGTEELAAQSVVAGKIKANEINANHLSTGELITLSAQIKAAIIDDAHITELNAAKLKAGTVLAGSIKVGADALTAIQANAAAGAQNPATRINAASTTIDPGKIQISGSTTLANWRMGGDLTSINGGAIAANTIAANKLTIGNRGITLDGITFEPNAGNVLHRLGWTAGSVRWLNDTGGTTQTNIGAGTAPWSSGTLFVYWVKGAASLSTTTAQATAFGENNVVLATYRGGMMLDADYGRTIIDGSSIKTGGITAEQIAANAIEATHIKAGTITADRIVLGGVSTDRLALNAATIVAANAMTGGTVPNIRAAFCPVPIYLDTACAVLMAATVHLQGQVDNPIPYEGLVLVNGVAHWAMHGTVGPGNNQGVTLNYAMWLNAGNHTLALSTRGGPSGAMSGVWASLAVIGAKR